MVIRGSLSVFLNVLDSKEKKEENIYKIKNWRSGG